MEEVGLVRRGFRRRHLLDRTRLPVLREHAFLRTVERLKESGMGVMLLTEKNATRFTGGDAGTVYVVCLDTGGGMHAVAVIQRSGERAILFDPQGCEEGAVAHTVRHAQRHGINIDPILIGGHQEGLDTCVFHVLAFALQREVPQGNDAAMLALSGI